MFFVKNNNFKNKNKETVIAFQRYLFDKRAFPGVLFQRSTWEKRKGKKNNTKKGRRHLNKEKKKKRLRYIYKN